MNRANNNAMRSKAGDIFPKVSDIKETGMLDQDANLIITLFDPMKHIAANPSMGTFSGYKVGAKLRNRFRAMGILKNREGDNNIKLGMIYMGECGFFKELPRADQTTDAFYDYIMAKKAYNQMSRKEKDEI